MEEFPSLYDLTYADYQEDIPFWIDLIGRTEVLELGVGTGRVALPLAVAGAGVTGLDHSLQMIRSARNKMTQAGSRINLVYSDLTRLPFSEGSFASVICPFSTINYVTDLAALRRAFSEARRVLRKGGLFAFEALSWHTYDRWLNNDGLQHVVDRVGKAPGEPIDITYSYQFDAAHQIATQERLYRVTVADGVRKEYLIHWRNRFAFRAEYLLLLEDSRFAIELEAGDYQGSTYSHDAEAYIVVCRAV
ncbi:class I SAM-dependent methyltransferase [Actinoplanes friuliensis]|uniref:Methyltransferase domain-containing protein n=1 Tax=Actinoplanes friuliensis DSM 7358 TaxID=1246995 RepID=U5VZD7_9ACTN|nr:class I SAM-dependent methyltransferase [Actinoplanes friuliensis]AGZ41060.1 hypothetical protein AFR_13870 [Actinoplanes friuliensis DSM 7358]